MSTRAQPSIIKIENAVERVSAQVAALEAKLTQKVNDLEAKLLGESGKEKVYTQGILHAILEHVVAHLRLNGYMIE